jgi:hypothetical protein
LYLTAGVMTQVAPVHLELGVVVHVHEFVDDSVFHVALVEEAALAENNSACFRAESPRFHRVTRSAKDVFGGDCCAAEA